ncbi:MAG: AAA family ATPase [Candidatus Magasanikbacteria bacterium]
MKSIEIHGFKSFAEKTFLSFLPPKGDHQSITVIVGPNGSGKSNVSDAIRWVLGEQSMKQLRGKKSSDIIFAGSVGKGQMSVASVTLILDNSDNRVSLDYEEVVISRRLYKTGDSEYLVNGNAVRLLDLQLLLAEAQFGHGSYSVIGQGMIDRLLLQSPQERKDFFDEATGIKEFQIKRHQAMLKLRRSREHMEQADMLLQEISPRLRSLSRQVKKLEQRQSLENKLTAAQEQYYVTLWSHHHGQSSALEEKLSRVKAVVEEEEAHVNTIQEELAGYAKEEPRQDIFDGLQQAYDDIVKKKHDLEREQAILAGRMQIEYSKAGKQQIGWLEQKVVSLSKNQADISKDLEALEKKASEVSQQYSAAKQEIQERELERTELRSRLMSLEQRQVQAQHTRDYRQFTGMRAVEGILSAKTDFGTVYGTVSELARVPDEYTTALDAAAGGHLTSIVVAEDRTAQRCIEYLRSERLGYATFLPVSRIKPRFIPKDLDHILGMEGVHGFAAELISHEKKFNDLFSYVLGSTLVVENIDIAREIGIGRVRMVTLDGDVMETSGSMKGGYRKRKFGDLSFANSAVSLGGEDGAEFEKEIQSTKEALHFIEEELEKNRTSLFSLESKREVAVGQKSAILTKKQELDTEVASMKQELSLHTMSSEDYDEVMKEVSVQKDNNEAQIKRIEEELLVAKEKLSAFHADEEKKKQAVFTLQDELQKKQEILTNIVSERNEFLIRLAKIETKLEDLEDELYQELRVSARDLAERIESEKSIEDIDEFQSDIQKLKYRLSLIGGIDEEVVAEYKETRERHDGLASQLDDLDKTIDDLESLVAELDTVMKKRREKTFRLIRKEFKRYFSILFEGGKADIIQLYTDEVEKPVEEEIDEEQMEDVAEGGEVSAKKKRKKKIFAGIEVEACPPGKKIKNIQALSGGERTLTSLALLCAILHTNPSPFVVLDEVEAALDEANTLRFTRILQELSSRSQFILITHNRATMHAADAMYGVTMGNDGISKLVSVSLEGK